MISASARRLHSPFWLICYFIFVLCVWSFLVCYAALCFLSMLVPITNCLWSTPVFCQLRCHLEAGTLASESHLFDYGFPLSIQSAESEYTNVFFFFFFFFFLSFFWFDIM
ncbi:hypothetical protein P170DRAFT_83650 [Aspergillus steynii IBT 23096]|uniref:Uncharacterized protein n=1 Tax=Aspergillus steynii IBT 23096 TaxID=1392250 RepID=A0A2I2GFQ0_9EURO|nr:uncharacterized protein P170DRAFT_83650 [Aspergillus steynii IBT 23096]PLB51706.1 hypothetical protein P170DRAFT_83650 [Aspergillus steynii IBT 23096]